MAQHTDVGVYHGKKRPAESDPDGDQPLIKRFGRLHIGMSYHGLGSFSLSVFPIAALLFRIPHLSASFFFLSLFFYFFLCFAYPSP